MGIKNTRHKGRIRIKGRPTDVAKAEIMVMKHEELVKSRERRRKLFNVLDFIIILALGLSMYSIWIKEYLNTILFLIVGTIPLVYFIVRRILKKKK